MIPGYCSNKYFFRWQEKVEYMSQVKTGCLTVSS